MIKVKAIETSRLIRRARIAISLYVAKTTPHPSFTCPVVAPNVPLPEPTIPPDTTST